MNAIRISDTSAKFSFTSGACCFIHNISSNKCKILNKNPNHYKENENKKDNDN